MTRKKIWFISGCCVLMAWGMYYLCFGDITYRLFIAIDNNRVSNAEQLINKGANINATRGFEIRKSPLQISIESGYVSMVSLLLHKGARLDILDYDLTPLDMSIDIAMNHYHYSSGRIKKGKNKQKEIIKLLLDVNAPTAKRPEFYAVLLSGDIDRVKEFLQKKSFNIKPEEHDAWNLLSRAILFSRNMEIITYMFHQFPDLVLIPTLMQHAVDTNDTEIVHYVLSQNDNQIHTKDAYEGTPLHHAAAHANLNIIKMLIEHGANPNAKDFYGKTPLFKAIYNQNNLQIMKFLIQHGANAFQEDTFENSLLHEAVGWQGRGSVELVHFLLALGLNPNKKNSEHETPLNIAEYMIETSKRSPRKKAYKEIVDLLRQYAS
jgi:hypothetical protein